VTGQDRPAARDRLRVTPKNQGRRDVVVTSMRQAVAIDPVFAGAELDLGCALAGEGRLAEAVQSFRRALAIQPELAKAHYHLANALWNQGHIAPALASYRRAIALDPGNEAARSNLAFALNYDAQTNPSEIYAAHLAWAALFPPPERTAHPNSR
jgi:protein O-GlcNAc transferase